MPSRVSRLAERGLAYWPAKRPMRITGRRAPITSTSDIWRRTLRLEATLESGEDRLLNFIYNNSLLLHFLNNFFVKMSRRSLWKTETKKFEFKIKLPQLKIADIYRSLRVP